MGARQKRWMVLVAGALFVVVMALWVFRTSQKEQAKKRAALGAETFRYSPRDPMNQSPAFQPNHPANNPAQDPNVIDSLRVINDINRIYQMHSQLKKNTPATPAPPQKDR